MLRLTAEFAKQSDKHLYEQLYEYIKEEIRQGRVLEGEKLPSKKMLASQLKLSVNTVETAYSILAQEGYVQSRPKSGYYVCKTDFPSAQGVDLGAPPKKTAKFRADFRTNAIDLEAFPASTWIKLSKEVMYNEPELLNSGDFHGDYELRAAIALYLYEFRGVICRPDQIVVGAGIEYLLMLLLQILPDKSVFALENPGYRKIRDIFDNAGAALNYISLDEDGMRPDLLCATNANIAYLTPSHQFPTGAIMTPSRRRAILDWAYAADGRYIIEDDFNSTLSYSIKPTPAIQSQRDHSRVIYVNTFSRTLAPSIRVSYMVLPPQLCEPFARKFGGFSSTVPRFEQHTLARFISDGYFERHLNRMRLLYRKRRDMVMEVLRNSGDKTMYVYGEKAGMHLLARTDFAQAIYEEARKNNIRLYRLDDYFFTPSEPTNTLIIGYAACHEEDAKLLQAVIQDAVKG